MTGPATLPLDEAATVTLDANGNGQVSLGPLSSRVTWVVLGAAVRVSTAVKEPICDVYNSSKGNLLGGTFTGSNDQIGLQVTLRGGRILAIWQGGDAGAVATLSITGTQTTTRS
jgi:hypothetical protein